MKNILNDTVDWLKSAQITKHCDSQTTFSCGKSKTPLTLELKGDFSVDGIQVLAAVGVMAVTCIALAVTKKMTK